MSKKLYQRTIAASAIVAASMLAFTAPALADEAPPVTCYEPAGPETGGGDPIFIPKFPPSSGEGEIVIKPIPFSNGLRISTAADTTPKDCTDPTETPETPGLPDLGGLLGSLSDLTGLLSLLK